ncbi:hypothetical protein [Streptomyces sp. NPDC058812]|uniref:hypothetical protein n=1 Tax=unclassified Streptomyces TaxID=2593676 RepID=UPI003692143E
MNAWLDAVAVLITAGGLVSAAAAYRVLHSASSAIAVLLDFLVAAGLVRLAGDRTWDGVVLAAAVVAVRKLISAGLGAARHGETTTGRHPRTVGGK